MIKATVIVGKMILAQKMNSQSDSTYIFLRSLVTVTLLELCSTFNSLMMIEVNTKNGIINPKINQ